MNDRPGSKPIPLKTGGLTVSEMQEEQVSEAKAVAATSLSVVLDCSAIINVRASVAERRLHGWADERTSGWTVKRKDGWIVDG